VGTPAAHPADVPAGPSRRAVLAGACGAGIATTLAGCSTYGGSTAGQNGSGASGGPASAAGGAGTVLAKVADIPVGGGKVLADRKVVLTQPQQGTIKGFSATCTHAGCTVAAVSGGTINCPCHGSQFRIADGSVAAGPAPRPLPPVAVTVTGDSITLA
jgi:nitrite reductase/ring-hydroxylating ferredoxin subunit